MAVFSRPHPEAQAVIDALEKGEATTAEQQCAAKLILDEMHRADNNAKNSQEKDQYAKGLAHAIKLMAGRS